MTRPSSKFAWRIGWAPARTLRVETSNTAAPRLSQPQGLGHWTNRLPQLYYVILLSQPTHFSWGALELFTARVAHYSAAVQPQHSPSPIFVLAESLRFSSLFGDIQHTPLYCPISISPPSYSLHLCDSNYLLCLYRAFFADDLAVDGPLRLHSAACRRCPHLPLQVFLCLSAALYTLTVAPNQLSSTQSQLLHSPGATTGSFPSVSSRLNLGLLPAGAVSVDPKLT